MQQCQKGRLKIHSKTALFDVISTALLHHILDNMH